jgi:hypothetical protein
MKGFFTSNTVHKHCCSPVMRGKAIIAAAFAVMMLLSLTACGKLPFLGKSDQDTSITENTDKSVDTIPPADTSISSDGDTAEDKDTPTNEDTSVDDSWKVDFEKSLLDNYGVKPDHYEELENGVYQVYVEIDGKIVPYVVVDSATGDYHG